MDNFLSGGSQPFGIQTSSIMSGEAADLIFGGVPVSADPSQAAPIKREPIKKKLIAKPIKVEDDDVDDDIDSNVDPEPTDIKFSAEDLLSQLDNENEELDDQDPVIPTKKPVEPAKPTEPQEDFSEFTEIAKELVKMGIFKERDEDAATPIKTGEALRDRFLKETQERANNEIYNFILSKHGDEGLEAFDAIFVKGVNPKDYLSRFVELQTFEDLDLTKEDNQKMVFREAQRRQGLPEDKIERRLQKVLDYGDLEEESKDLHEVILKQDRDDMNLKIAEAQEAEATKRGQRQEYLNNMNVIIGQKLKDRDFDGIPVTDKVARETYDYLTTEKWVMPTGEKLTDFDKDILELRDPKNHEFRVKLALLLKSKLDLTKVKTKAITTDSNRVFDSLVRRDAQVRRERKTTQPNSSFLDNL